MKTKYCKKYFTTITILIFIASCIIPSAGTIPEKSSNVFFNGKTLYVGGSGSDNYSKIQDAINNATNGDTIYVYSGIYKENIVISKSLTLIGEEKNITIIDGCEKNYVIQIIANLTKIIYFTIQNSSENGININGSKCTIDNNIIQSNGYLGISIKNSKDTIISNNIIKINERGLCLCLYWSEPPIVHNKLR